MAWQIDSSNTSPLTEVSVDRVVSRALGPDRAFRRVTDIAEFPKYMDDVRAVSVRGGDTSDWDVEIDGCPLSWRQRDDVDGTRRVYEFESIEGDFETFEGTWSVRETPEGSSITFRLGYCVGIPVIEDVIGPVLRSKVQDNITRMIDAVTRELEAELPASYRETRRVPVDIPTRVRVGDAVFGGNLVELADGGAALWLPVGLQQGQPLSFSLSTLSEVRQVAGEVLWTDGEGRSVLGLDQNAEQLGEFLPKVVRDIAVGGGQGALSASAAAAPHSSL